MFATGSITAIIYWCQLGTMHDQLGAMKTQADVMNQQLDEMRIDQRIDQRAWMAPSDVKPHPILNEIYFDVTFENTGKTPALEIHSRIGMDVDENRIPNKDDEPKEPFEKGLCAAGTGYLCTTSSLQPGFQMIMSKLFQKGSTHLMFTEQFGIKIYSEKIIARNTVL